MKTCTPEKKSELIGEEQALHKLKAMFSIYQANFCTVSDITFTTRKWL